jgi:hypothetical protein
MLNAYDCKHNNISVKSQHLFVLSIFRTFSLLKGLLTAVINQLSSLFFASVQDEIDLIELEAKR